MVATRSAAIGGAADLDAAGRAQRALSGQLLAGGKGVMGICRVGIGALPMPTRNAEGHIQTTRGHGALRLCSPALATTRNALP